MSDAIGYAKQNDVYYLKISGALRHDSAAPLDALIERWFENETCDFTAVVIDLNETVFMDSTAIGLLASIAREMLARGLNAPTVFSANSEINQLLQSLRLDEVFTLVQKTTSGIECISAQSVASEQCGAAVILKAHEALVELNEANRVAFQSVIDLFRSELGG